MIILFPRFDQNDLNLNLAFSTVERKGTGPKFRSWLEPNILKPESSSSFGSQARAWLSLIEYTFQKFISKISKFSYSNWYCPKNLNQLCKIMLSQTRALFSSLASVPYRLYLRLHKKSKLELDRVYCTSTLIETFFKQIQLLSSKLVLNV